MSTPSDTKFFEQTPRAVESYLCPTRRCPVVTFHYYDGTQHTIECLTEADVDQAQALASRIGVRL